MASWDIGEFGRLHADGFGIRLKLASAEADVRVALTACWRGQLVALNAMIRDEADWNLPVAA